MKILQIATRPSYPPKDGGKIAIYGLTKQLTKLGHEVFFVCYQQNTNKDLTESELKKICKPYLIKGKTNYNVVKAIINLFSKIPYNLYIYQKRSIKKFLKQFLSENKIDIVHIEHLHMAWLVDFIRKCVSVPVILRQHNIEMIIMKRFYEKQKNPFLKFYAYLQYKKFLKYEPYMCGEFDKCVFITKDDEKLIKDLNPLINSVTISAGVESELLNRKKVVKEKYSIVHIGSMDWIPNYDGLNWFLNNIFPGLIKKNNQIKLYIYGKNTEKLAMSQDIRSNVVINGFVEDIYSEIENKELLIVPLRIGSGMRIKIIEMMALGMGIVTTSVGKEGIPVTDKEHLLIADTEIEFQNKILDYFNDRYNKDLISHNAREFIKTSYTWEKIVKQFESIYIELLNSNIRN